MGGRKCVGQAEGGLQRRSCVTVGTWAAAGWRRHLQLVTITAGTCHPVQNRECVSGLHPTCEPHSVSSAVTGAESLPWGSCFAFPGQLDWPEVVAAPCVRCRELGATPSAGRLLGTCPRLSALG